MSSVTSDPALAHLHTFAEQAAAHWQQEQNYPALHAVMTLLRRDDIRQAAYEIGHEASARSMHGAYLSGRKFLLTCLNAGPFAGQDWQEVLKDKGVVWTGLRYAVIPNGLGQADCDVCSIPERHRRLIDRAILLASEERVGGKSRVTVEPNELPYMICYLSQHDKKRKECRLAAMAMENGRSHEALLESARAKLVRLGRALQVDLPAELFSAMEGEKIIVYPRRQTIKRLGQRPSSARPEAKVKSVPAVGAFLDRYGLSGH